MKFLVFLQIMFLSLFSFADTTTTSDTYDWSAIFSFLTNIYPSISNTLMILGSIVVIGTGLDYMIPDTKDNGFMKKVLAIPILGSFLSALTKFSPFNYNADK